jgi:hypothetical protein
MRHGVGVGARPGWPVDVVVVVALMLLAGMGWPATRPAGATPLSSHAYPNTGMIGFGSVDLTTDSVPTPLNSPIFTGVASPDGKGYLVASADGGVFASGDARYEGSLGNLMLNGPIVAMAGTPSGGGYWLGAVDGGVFSFGDAQYFGSMGAVHLNQPIVGMAATPTGKGYWMVAADGGIFSFGDAQYFGSMGAVRLNQPIVGMAATPTGKGYWLVAADGGIFSFGDANFQGSLAAQDLPDPVVGMFASPDGGGYTMTTANGVVFALGDAHAYGGLTLNPTATPISAIIGNGTGDGYWLLDPEAWPYAFSNPIPQDTFPGSAAIVSAAASQIEPDPDHGYNCNPYGPCEEWCSLFATWAWQQGRVPIPSIPFTGNMYGWAASHGTVLPPTATPFPGDGVLYGTGPQNAATSVHVGIVTQVWPDGALIEVSGNSGPGRNGSLSVTINGPYLPADSLAYNGSPIYAFIRP